MERWVAVARAEAVAVAIVRALLSQSEGVYSRCRLYVVHTIHTHTHIHTHSVVLGWT